MSAAAFIPKANGDDGAGIRRFFDSGFVTPVGSATAPDVGCYLDLAAKIVEFESMKIELEARIRAHAVSQSVAKDSTTLATAAESMKPSASAQEPEGVAGEDKRWPRQRSQHLPTDLEATRCCNAISRIAQEYLQDSVKPVMVALVRDTSKIASTVVCHSANCI